MAETSSLIPKKASSGVEYYRTEGLGSLLRLTLILFVLACVFTGVLFAYKAVLTKQLVDQRQILEDLRVRFEPTLITQLEHVANKMANAKSLLKGHIYITPIFNFMEKNTLPNVSFSSVNYNADKKILTLSGEATSYTEVSAQVKVFRNQPEVLNTTFSNTTLREEGSVVFSSVITFK